MDVLFSLITGLGLRLVLCGLDEPLGMLGPVLLGLWEGAAVYHLSGPASPDHYLAYALRAAVDLYFTANIQRTFVVLVWTVLGVVASDTVQASRPHRRDRRRRVSRHRSTVVVAAVPPQLTPAPVDRPPTPPSLFLSDSPSPQPQYLPSALPETGDSSDSTPPKPIHLPTPPAPPDSTHRLSTIEEISSSAEEGSFGPQPPLPVPIRYIVQQDSESRPDDCDPLQTPPAPGTPWEPTHNDDSLTTPLPNELSPLVLERPIFPSFADILDFGPSSVAQPVPALDTGGVEITGQVAGPSAVEYPSTPVLADTVPSCDPNPATFEPLEPGPPEPEQPSSYPTPDPSPTTERVQRYGLHEQHDNDDDDVDRKEEHDPGTPTPAGISSFVEAETETETDATSVISSGPARAIYTRAEDLRTQARAAEAEYARLQGLKKAATNVRDKLFLSEDIRSEAEKAAKLHDKAARRFFEARNTARKRNPYDIDVHGLRVAEAIRVTEKKLCEALRHAHPSVRIIVGKGLHSTNGVPVLKDAVMRVMKGYKVVCRVDPGNAGVLIVTLPTN